MPRQDTFTIIHKGLRTLIYKMGSSMQSADFSEPAATSLLASQVNHGLEILAAHGGHEERFVFPRLVSHAPELVGTAEEHHKQIHARIERVHQSVAVTAEEPDTMCRVELGEQLNRDLNGLLSFYLTHLCYEEDNLQPVTYQALTDDEIVAIRVAIQRSMPEEAYMEFLKLVLASANNPELISILAGTKAGAPPNVVQYLLGLFDEVLPSERVQLLRERAQL